MSNGLIQDEVKSYQNGHLFNLIHAIKPKQEEEHLVVTPLPPKKKQITKSNVPNQQTDQTVNNSNLISSSDKAQSVPSQPENRHENADHLQNQQHQAKGQVKDDTNSSLASPQNDLVHTEQPSSINQSANESAAVYHTNQEQPNQTINYTGPNTAMQDDNNSPMGSTNTANSSSLSNASVDNLTALVNHRQGQNSSVATIHPKLNTKFVTNQSKTNDDQHFARLQEQSNSQLEKQSSQQSQMANAMTNNGRPSVGEKVLHPSGTHQSSADSHNQELLNEIKQSAQIMSFVAHTNHTHVTIQDELDKLPLRQINVLNLKTHEPAKIMFDSMLMHVLGSVIIDRRQVVSLLFRDGTTFVLAPDKWLQIPNVYDVLIQNHYTWVYQNLNLTALQQTLRQLSGSVITNTEYNQYWLNFMPIVTSDSQ